MECLRLHWCLSLPLPSLHWLLFCLCLSLLAWLAIPHDELSPSVVAGQRQRPLGRSARRFGVGIGVGIGVQIGVQLRILHLHLHLPRLELHLLLHLRFEFSLQFLLESFVVVVVVKWRCIATVVVVVVVGLNWGLGLCCEGYCHGSEFGRSRSKLLPLFPAERTLGTELRFDARDRNVALAFD